MQTLGAGSAQPWALWANPRAWLQPQGERVCRAAILGFAAPSIWLADPRARCRPARWVQTRPPRSILTHARFRRLPLGFRAGSVDPVEKKNKKNIITIIIIIIVNNFFKKNLLLQKLQPNKFNIIINMINIIICILNIIIKSINIKNIIIVK